jgi:hypothetical protein
MIDQFSHEVVKAVQAADNIAEALVDQFLLYYVQVQPTIEGAPAPAVATLYDAVAIARVGTYSAEVDKNWAGFKTRLGAVERTEARSFNPYLPRWDGKTEDRQFPWAEHTGPVADHCRILLDKAFEDASPSGWGQEIGGAPTNDQAVLDEVIAAMGSVYATYLVPMGDGEKNPDWAWGPALCTAAGLGLAGARRLMRYAHDSDMLQHWAACPDEELVTAIRECQLTSGYPLGLLRAEWRKIRAALSQDEWLTPAGGPRYVGWLRGVILLHWFKHTRLLIRDGEAILTAAYRGSYIRRTLDLEGLNTGWLDKQNLAAIGDICSKLDLPISNAKNATFLDATVRSVLADIRPSMTIRTRHVHTKPQYLPGPTVVFDAIPADRYSYNWVDTGIGVRNVATLDLDTGKVDIDAPVIGADVLAMAWPQAEVTHEDILNWRGALPAVVEPIRPSEFISKYIRNRNCLGHKEAADAIIDAIIVSDMFRTELAGTPLGMTLTNEFPPVFILPMGATQEETSNQGKSMLGRIFGKVFVPALDMIQFSSLTSAPAQRSVADPIYRHGTALYDEFLLPDDPAHFLNKQGLQSLATGGRAGPGQAGENGPPPRLFHSMIFVTKLAAFPEDIYNRMAPIFMDKLSDASRSQEDELAMITSGRASLELRLSCLMWVHRINLLPYLREQKLADGSVWRFNAHLTVAQAFATREQIAGYFAAARVQCRSQLEQAEETGLSSDLNIKHAFDPGYYLDTVDVFELAALAEQSKGLEKGHPLTPLEFVTKIVCNGSKRKLETEMRKFHVQEKAMPVKFSVYLRLNPDKVYQGYKILAVPAAESQIKDSAGRRRAYIHVTKA